MSSPIRSTVTALLVTLALLTSVGVSEGTVRGAASRRPLVSFTGADTRITTHQRLRITTKEAWVQFWLRHEGKTGSPQDYDRYWPSGAPEIDFNHCMVIAITESPGERNAGIVAVAITDTTDQITFDYDNLFYQARPSTSAPGNAYGYYVLPRSAKTIVLRRNFQDGRSRFDGGPPVWKEVARFGPLETIPTDAVTLLPAAVNVVFAHDPGRGRYDGVVGNPHDTWNLVDVGTTMVKALRSREGAATNVTLKISDNDGEWGIKEQSGVFHGYIYHNCQCVDLQATFCGLPPGRYKMYVFAHGDAPDQNAEIELLAGGEKFGTKATLNDGSWNFRSPTLAEGVQYVSFEFDVFGDEPVRITSKRAGSSYSMLNAIQIVPVSR